MAELKVAMLQLQVAMGDPQTNLEKALTMLEQGAEQGAQLAVLPETWTTGYAFDRLQDVAEEPGETGQCPTVQRLQEFAARKKMWIFSGSLVERIEGSLYNTTYIIRSDGSIAGKYSKLHLFGLMDEDKHFKPGKDLCLVDTPWGKAAPIICYDLRFPELSRKLAEQGASILVVPAHWPAARVDHWRLLNQARAVENQIFVLAVNSAGLTGPTSFGGNSMAIGPWGQILAEGGGEEQLLLVTIDLSSLPEVRNTIPVWRDRRRDIY
ncbi:MAG TPA: carbon-nitrogen family hydrolase [Bacillota bacterium]|nr:carbon-nitrogen family hydrolase [Bacillota bacterium]